MSDVTTHSITVRTTFGDVPLTYSERGQGHSFLVLHGGAGPKSVSDFADLLADLHHARVITPTNPGFDGTPRPEGLKDIKSLAETHLALLDELDGHDVTIVGNSIGGWAAAEMALLHSPRVSSVILVDAVGLISEREPTKNFFALTMDEVTDISYFQPDRFRTDFAALPESVRRNMAANRATMRALAGIEMGDATLESRLPSINTPALIVWGAADRMVQLSHGQTYAAAIPGARLSVIDDAGHLPQIETPHRLVTLAWNFADEHATMRPDS